MSKRDTSIVLFSTADWDEPYWTNKQHTAQSLSKLGFFIVYVESIGLRTPKIGSSKDIKRICNRIFSGLKTFLFGAVKKESNIVVLSPLVIPNANDNKLVSKVNDVILTYLIRREIKKANNRKSLFWTYHPFVINILSYLNNEKIIYHCVDDLSQIPGIDEKKFRLKEELFLSKCDCVFVTTKSLEKRCKEFNNNVYFFSNVVDYEHFSNPSMLHSNIDKIGSIKNNNRKKIVYHGVLSDFKVDFNLLKEVAKKCSEYDFYIIGQEREGQNSVIFNELILFPNVYHISYVPYRDLPELLSFMDVGILPTLLNQYTYSMFPMKYYEYVAAKLPVVSTPLDFTSYTQNESLNVAIDSNEFINKIKTSIKTGKLSESVAKEIVGENTWSSRTQKMINIIEGL